MKTAEACDFLTEAIYEGSVNTPVGILVCTKSKKDVTGKNGGYRTTKSKSFTLNGEKITQRNFLRLSEDFKE